MKPLLLPSLLSLALVGCVSVPTNPEIDQQSITDSVQSGWNDTPAIQVSERALGYQVDGPMKLPRSLYEKPISVDLQRPLTLHEVIAVLGVNGIPAVTLGAKVRTERTIVSETDKAESGSSVLDTENASNDEVAETDESQSTTNNDPGEVEERVGKSSYSLEGDADRFFLPPFSGSTGQFLNLISEMYGVSMRWENGVLWIEEASQYLVRVPQNDTIIEELAESITAMGGTINSTSINAGLISYSAANQQQETIREFIDASLTNTARVNLQVAVLNVNLNSERRQGLNWSSLSATIGEQGLLASDTLPSVEGGAEASGDSAASAVTGALAQLSGGGVSFVLNESSLNLSGVLNALSQYGDSQTTQNLTLQTLSSIEVSLNSGEKIPFIGSQTVSIVEGNVVGGSETESVDTGFKATLLPYYNSAEREVTINVELSLTSLVGFRELTANGSNATTSVPQIREEELTNLVRLKAGDSALIGGLVYESTSDERSTLAGLERFRIGGKTAKTRKSAIFILIRPTVVVATPPLSLTLETGDD